MRGKVNPNPGDHGFDHNSLSKADLEAALAEALEDYRISALGMVQAFKEKEAAVARAERAEAALTEIAFYVGMERADDAGRMARIARDALVAQQKRSNEPPVAR